MWIEAPGRDGNAAPPTVELDAEWDFAFIPIVAAMTWPRCRRRQSEATATFAAQMTAFIEAISPADVEQGLPKTIARAAERLGVPKAEVLSMPHTRELVSEAMRRLPEFQAEFQGRVDQELFRRAGGLHSVASAPGSSVLSDEMRKAADGGAYACGARLLLVARLARFHRDLSASLNRADAILDAVNASRGSAKLPQTRAIKNAWREWGGVAPLWAAFIGARGDAALGSTSPQETASRLFEDVPARWRMIGWAKWFRAFAVGHKPPGASRTILAEHEAVLITGSAPEVPPPLAPLTSDLLEAAHAYKAPKSVY